jgi:hypothetical protein
MQDKSNQIYSLRGLLKAYYDSSQGSTFKSEPHNIWSSITSYLIRIISEIPRDHKRPEVLSNFFTLYSVNIEIVIGVISKDLVSYIDSSLCTNYLIVITNRINSTKFIPLVGDLNSIEIDLRPQDNLQNDIILRDDNLADQIMRELSELNIACQCYAAKIQNQYVKVITFR